MRNRIFIIVAGLIVIVFFFFRLRPLDYNQKIELAVLEQIETDFFWRTLRYIPESISERFSLTLFKEKEETKIYCVNYSYKSVFYSFYYVVDENGDIENIKKGLISSPSNKFDLTDLIQKGSFNKIVKEFNWSDTISIHNFSFFLSNFCERKYSLPLENGDDYEDIIKLHPLSKDREIILTQLLSREKIEYILNKEDSNTYYYWYYDQGVIKISYHLIDGEIKSAKSSFVGYLGNEVIHM